MIKKTGIGLIIILVLIQFIRPAKNEGPADIAADITHAVTVPADIKVLLERSCYDCHSNHTRYPWYTAINPVGLWLNHHIKEGKEELNFSEFANYTKKRGMHKMDEVVEQLQQHEMPLNSYLWVHKDARLNEEQVNKIITWASTAKEELSLRP